MPAKAKKTKVLSESDVKLQQLLDQEMQQLFDELQEDSDPDEPWRDWGDEARQIFYEWCMEMDTLTATKRMKVDLWKALSRF